MGIIQTIERKYPIDMHILGGENNVSITAAYDGVPAEVESAIEDGLFNRMLFRRATGTSNVVNVAVKAEDKFYRVDVLNNHFFVLRDNSSAADSVLWGVYAITHLDMEEKLKDDRILSAKGYSMEQQDAAARLLGNVREQFDNAPIEDEVKKHFKNIKIDYVEKLCDKAPRFSNRPIHDKEYNNLHSAFGFRKAVKEQMISDAAELLYGTETGEFEEEIEAWCSFVKTRREYAEAINRARKYLEKGIYEMPCYAAENALQRIRTLAFQESRESNDRITIDMDDDCTISRLTPQNVERAFDEVDDYYKNLTTSKFNKVFFDDLLNDEYIESIKEKLRKAKETLNMMRTELADFCRISVKSDERLNWYELCNFDAEQICCRKYAWDKDSINALQQKMIGQPGSRAWICSHELYEESMLVQDRALMQPVNLPGNNYVFLINITERTEKTEGGNE